mgnify:CR=1 FL=1
MNTKFTLDLDYEVVDNIVKGILLELYEELKDTQEKMKADFDNLHIAGHPEGSMDIDPDGSTNNVDQALSWKNEYSKRTDANMAITTQFSFDASSKY